MNIFVALLAISVLRFERVNTEHSNLQEVLKLFQTEKVPVILFDRRILSQIAEDGFEEAEPIESCDVQVHLATFASHLNFDKQNILRTRFEENKHEVRFLKSLNPWDVNKDETLSHFIVVRGDFTVIVTILYERLSEYWWYFTITEGNESNLRSVQKFTLKKLEMNDTKMLVPTKPKEFLEKLDDRVFKPCNYTRSLEFYRNYPQDVSSDAEDFRRRAYMLLKAAKKLLDELKIPFWLSSGTCLGFYRQCDIITYTKDVDIGIFIADYRPEIIPKFVSNGLRLIRLFGMENDSFELTFEMLGVTLDIFFFYKEEKYFWNGGVQARTGRKFKYIFPKFDLCWTEFLKLRVRVPCDTGKYVEANYGDDWSVPTSVWDWKSSPPNVRNNGIWPRTLWSRVIQDHRHLCIVK